MVRFVCRIWVNSNEVHNLYTTPSSRPAPTALYSVFPTFASLAILRLRTSPNARLPVNAVKTAKSAKYGSVGISVSDVQ